MSSTPLDRFPLLRSADVEHTREVIYHFVHRHPIDLVRPDDGLDAYINGRRLDRIGAAYLSFGAEARTTPGELDFYLLQVVLSGSYTVWLGDREIGARPGSAVVLSPGDDVRTWWSADCGLLCFKVGAADYQEHLAGLLARPMRERLRFEPEMDLLSGSGRDLNVGIIRPLTQRLNQVFGLVAHSVLVQQLEDTLLTGLLLAQPNTYSSALG
ncbi:cupin domain-containing protein [Jiangella endophytica]|uniref:cupin domain-containing protein n=1 Tax=Jiangella endophytica TaxID=1623398 RepID=UPI000E34B93A|nr:AraC family ligand binding domain-containing protein [Jiangella endophytica]